MNISIEIERNNVTVAEFFSYIKRRHAQKGIAGWFGIDRDYFENPFKPSYSSYFVRDGRRHNTVGYPRTIPARGFSPQSGITETVMEYRSYENDGADAAAEAETNRNLPYHYQTYIRFFDGSVFNEICEFTFDDEKRGHGYYYLLNKDAEENYQTTEEKVSA